MWSRPDRAGSMPSAVSPSAYLYPSLPRMRWSPPEQNAQPPSRGDGPLPVSRTQPTSGLWRAWSSTRYSSSTVAGRNALRISGRSNATRTQPTSTARWYVMSCRSSKPGTSCQARGSKISDTVSVTGQPSPLARRMPEAIIGNCIGSRSQAAMAAGFVGLPAWIAMLMFAG